jgi:hypothetical protein
VFTWLSIGFRDGTMHAKERGSTVEESEDIMELARRFVATRPTRFAAYVSLQCALMRRHISRGGSAEDFCHRLAPVYRRRYAELLNDFPLSPLPPHR